VEFIALVTGLSVHCSAAVLQGIMGRATPFVRTPKLAVTGKSDGFAEKHEYNISSLPPGIVIELCLAAMFLGLVLFSYGHAAFAFAGVYIFYAIGFGMVSYLSLREVFARSAV
jgi:hypothetical protein